MSKKPVKSIRLDLETHVLIDFLKTNNIIWSELVHNKIKDILTKKAKLMNFELKKGRCPF